METDDVNWWRQQGKDSFYLSLGKDTKYIHPHRNAPMDNKCMYFLV